VHKIIQQWPKLFDNGNVFTNILPTVTNPAQNFRRTRTCNVLTKYHNV